MNSNDHLLNLFQKIYGPGGEIISGRAPGRVNLIGEHTDYNGGHVFPCALTIGTYAVIKKNPDKLLRFYSMNFQQIGVIRSTIENLQYDKGDDWANYPKAVIWALEQKGYKIQQGMDILYYGNIPNQSGLSSSASIEVLTGYIVKELFHFNFDMVELAKICQYAENQFIGVN
ncbi:MAG TPA: galactokinase, partial [Firmicutes bacterium]|nr:galactokinase [Bacillota bacterium]